MRYPVRATAILLTTFCGTMVVVADEPSLGLVDMNCSIHEHSKASQQRLVSRPKLSTVPGNAARITTTKGAGDGQPGVTLDIQLTPTLDGKQLRVAGTISLKTTDRDEAVVEQVATDELEPDVNVELQVSEMTSYRITCSPALVAGD